LFGFGDTDTRSLEFEEVSIFCLPCSIECGNGLSCLEIMLWCNVFSGKFNCKFCGIDGCRIPEIVENGFISKGLKGRGLNFIGTWGKFVGLLDGVRQLLLKDGNEVFVAGMEVIVKEGCAGVLTVL
jgi:hypothetical protein